MNKKALAIITIAGTTMTALLPSTAYADEAGAGAPEPISPSTVDSTTTATPQPGTKEHLEQAQTKYDEAKANVIEKQAKVEAANDVIAKGNEALEQVQKASDEADAQLKQAQQNTEQAAQGIINAQASVDQAQKELDSFDQQAAQQKLDAAKSDMDAAQADHKTAQDDLAQAGKDEEARQTDVTKATEDLNNAKTEYENAVKERDEIMNSVSNMGVAAAKEKLEKAQAAVDAAKTTLDSAKSAAEASQKSLDGLKASKSDADSKVATAQSDASKLKNAADSADAKIKEGSLGWFKSRGSNQAVKVLTDKSAANGANPSQLDYVQLGDEADATSLKNMRASIEYMRQCNDLRARHGLPPLKVSDYLMATAQADADYARDHAAHPKQFNVGENLAWNYQDAPFAAWYTNEKAKYDAGERDFMKVGHYLNIIDPDYNITGFSIVDSRAIYKGSKTYAQNFQYQPTWNDGSAHDKTQSVDEYEQAFNEYYDSIYNARENYDKAVAALKTAQDKAASLADQVKAAQGDLDGKREAQVAAHEALNKADEALVSAQKEYKEALKGAVDGDSKVQEANKKVADAKVKVTKSEDALKSAQVDLKKAQDYKADAQSKVDSTKAAYDKAVKAYEDAQAGMSTDALKAKVEEAKKAVVSAKATYDDAVTVMLEAQSKADNLKPVLKAGKEALAKAYDAQKAALAERNEAAKGLDEALANLSLAETLYKQAQEEAGKDDPNKGSDVTPDDPKGDDQGKTDDASDVVDGDDSDADDDAVRPAVDRKSDGDAKRADGDRVKTVAQKDAVAKSDDGDLAATGSTVLEAGAAGVTSLILAVGVMGALKRRRQVED